MHRTESLNSDETAALHLKKEIIKTKNEELLGKNARAN